MATDGLTAGRPRPALPPWLLGALALTLAAGFLTALVAGLDRTRSAVVVSVEGRSFQVRTHASTVGAALSQAGVELAAEDRVVPGLESPLCAGLEIQVQKARPVTLDADAQVRQIRTHASTIGELLAECQLQTGPGDEVWLNGELSTLDASLLPMPSAAPRQVSSRAGERQASRPPGTDPPLVTLRRATTLTLDDGGVTRVVHTTATSVGQLLEQLGIVVYLGDRVTPGHEAPLTPGLVVTIVRSIPVQIVVDGGTLRTRTLAENVAGVLGQERIALVGKDWVEPGLSAPVQSGMEIRVTRVREELVVEFEPIPYDTVWVPDPELEIDHSRLAQEGQVGLTKRRYRVVYEDGREVSRALEDSWAEQQPVTKTLAYGTKIVIRTMDTPDGPIEYWRKMRVYTTSYTAASSGKLLDHPRFGYTRLGWKLTKGIVAVDPTVIPLKTKLYVPGYGLARAGDTGGGIKGKFVDLGFDRENYQSWHWWTDVYLLTPVPPHSQIRWILPDWPRYPDRRR